MTVVNLPEIVFSHSELCENGQMRLRESLAPSSKTKLTITVGSDKVRFIYAWRIGDSAANIFYLNFVGVRNWDGNRVLIGQEQQWLTNHCFPFLIAKGSDGYVEVENSSSQTTDCFEITLDYFDIDAKLIKVIEKYTKWDFKM